MNFLTILIAILIFLIVIWFLVLILLFARKKLVPEKKVKIIINGDNECEAQYGYNLMQALGEHKIYIPSACGGVGTCGACKGIILSGGGDILPTEKMHINRKMEKENYRLFCQVKVKNDMEIKIPEEILEVQKWECNVISNQSVATYIRELVLELPAHAHFHFKSGSYVQIDAPKTKISFDQFDIEEQYRQEWESFQLFKLVTKIPQPTMRAYSIANAPMENDKIVLNVRIALPPFNPKTKKIKNVTPGLVSSYIYSLKSGDKVTLSGPFGEFFLRDTTNEKMFIGGGAGMAPLRSHILHLFKEQQTQSKVTFWYGGRSLRELFYMQEFEKIAAENSNFSFNVALSEPKKEDQWQGHTGFIHQVIDDHYLHHHPTPEEIEYYICGPQPMLHAVLKMLDLLGVPDNMIFYDDFGN